MWERISVQGDLTHVKRNSRVSPCLMNSSWFCVWHIL